MKNTPEPSFLTRFKDALYPFFAYWLFSICALALLCGVSILKLLPEFLQVSNAPEKVTPGNLIQPVLKNLDSVPHISSIATYIFWAFVGILTYLIVITCYNVLYAAKNDISLAEHYLHPYNTKQVSIARTITLHWAVFLSTLFITAVLAIVTLAVLLPVFKVLFISGFANPTVAGSWVNTIASSLALAFVLYCFVFLVKLIRRSFSIL